MCTNVAFTLRLEFHVHLILFGFVAKAVVASFSAREDFKINFGYFQFYKYNCAIFVHFCIDCIL